MKRYSMSETRDYTFRRCIHVNMWWNTSQNYEYIDFSRLRMTINKLYHFYACAWCWDFAHLDAGVGCKMKEVQNETFITVIEIPFFLV